VKALRKEGFFVSSANGRSAGLIPEDLVTLKERIPRRLRLLGMTGERAENKLGL
jgi:hypothetical protein